MTAYEMVIQCRSIVVDSIATTFAKLYVSVLKDVFHTNTVLTNIKLV